MPYTDYLNNVSPASQVENIFFLKETMKTAGYTVTGSGDGLSAHSAVGDIITTALTGANGLDNPNAWFTIQQPAGGSGSYQGTREWLFQRDPASPGTAYIWKCEYSGPQIIFDQATGSATVSPDGTTPELVKSFNNSSGFTTILPTNKTYTFQIRIGDSTENFHWYCISYPNGGGAINSRIAFVPLCVNSDATSDTDPFILGASINSLTSNNLITPSSSNMFCWQGDSLLEVNYAQLNAFNLQNANSEVIFPDASGPNPENNRSDGLSMYWGRRSSLAVHGLKGATDKVKWTGTNRATGDTYDSLNFIVFDDTIWEWDGLTVPSV